MIDNFIKLWEFNYSRSGALSIGIYKEGYLGIRFFDFEYDIYSTYRVGMDRDDYNKMKEWANGYKDQEFITSGKGATWGGLGPSKTYFRFFIDHVKRFGRDDYPIHKIGIYLDSTLEPHNIPPDKTIEELNEKDAIAGIIEYEIPFNGADETARPGNTLEDLRTALDCIGAFNLDYFDSE